MSNVRAHVPAPPGTSSQRCASSRSCSCRFGSVRVRCAAAPVAVGTCSHCRPELLAHGVASSVASGARRFVELAVAVRWKHNALVWFRRSNVLSGNSVSYAALRFSFISTSGSAASGCVGVAPRSVVRSSINERSNPSVERTANGGPRSFASSRSATPLAAAHLKR